MRTLFLSLPSPPGSNIARDLAFGVATKSKREKYGHDGHAIPPLFDAYAAAILEDRGLEAEILDCQVRRLDLPELHREVEERRPDVIVSRISLPAFRKDVEILAGIKEILPNVFLIGWGLICTVESREVLAKSKIDMVLRGEIEFTVAEVLDRLEAGKDLRGVEGTSLKKGNEIIEGPSRPLFNLNQLPLPAYHLMDMDKYLFEEKYFLPNAPKKKHVRYFTVLTSRGCSFNCIYCPYPLGSGKVWRGMKPSKSVDEMEELRNNYGIHNIWFRDQTFSMNVKRAIGICDEILKRGLDIRWICETRADRITRELANKMRQAGCVWVQLGVETGDPMILREVGKPGNTLETIERGFKITREAGVRRGANVMVGLPRESWESVKKTSSFVKRLDPDAITVDVVTPYPGTVLYEMAKENNWLITEDWERYTTVDPVMTLTDFTSEDMLRARRYLLDQMRVKARTKAVTQAIRQKDLLSVIRESIRLISTLPPNWRRLLNLVRSRLK